MRIAILADIHGNPRALDAVIEDIAAQHVDEVIVGGDLVGRGPRGREVVERVQELGWPSVRGNHEDYLIAFFREDVPADWLTSDYWCASRWMAAELGADGVAYADSLPMTLRSTLAPELLVVHGTPESNQQGIYTWTTEDEVDAIVSPVEARIMACAHTHRPLVFERDDTTVVNVGSVGLPFNGDTRAQYAILERGDDGAWSVDQRHVDYDRDAFVADYEATGFLEGGGITSALLVKEIEHARPFLVPFIKWAELSGTEPDMDAVARFLEVFDHTLSMRELWEHFQKTGALPERD